MSSRTSQLAASEMSPPAAPPDIALKRTLTLTNAVLYGLSWPPTSC